MNNRLFLENIFFNAIFEIDYLTFNEQRDWKFTPGVVLGATGKVF